MGFRGGHAHTLSLYVRVFTVTVNFTVYVCIYIMHMLLMYVVCILVLHFMQELYTNIDA